MFFYNVALDVPLNKTFTYKSDLELPIGKRVMVEFINKNLVGVVWQQLSLAEIDYDISKIKPILHEFAECITNDVIELVKFISNYYHYPIGQSLITAIPRLFRQTKPINLNTPKYISIINKDHELFHKKLSVKHKELYISLQQQNISISLAKEIVGSNYKKLIDKWLELGIIKYVENIDHNVRHLYTANVVPLNQEQQATVDGITVNFGHYAPAILYGITGSGKTEVYLELIKRVIEAGRQVLVLVPEINLTPQLLDRFKKRFPSVNMQILTSNVNDKQRVIAYLEAEKGHAQIIIGTRMAVFTPFKNLGLIIIDEEHDGSFKQNEGLRYNARDLAVYRAKYHNIPIILGSATPSLETLYNYKLKKYALYKLSTRGVKDAVLPKIKLIDLKTTELFNGLTNTVVEAIQKRLENKELSLIYINRRGYAPVISCYDCGWISSCKNCSSNMVYHANGAKLKCHHCGFSCQSPRSCPKCNSKYIQAVGQGTQKVEETLKEQFPDARIMRIDQDTTNNKSAWDDLYYKVHNNQIDILVGTQMLTKGHDFHNLTLVVGLNIDSGLYSYDFRATEFLFVQLMQVSGRAGRGNKEGEVLLQSYYPSHELYQFLLNHDFSGFANYLLTQRKVLALPPYTFYVIFRASSYKIDTTMEFLHQIHQIMQRNKPQDVEVFQPVPSVMQKLKNKERGQILFASNSRNALHAFIDNIIPLINSRKHKADLLWYIDIDPTDI